MTSEESTESTARPVRVQVVPIEEGREIGWRSSVSEQLEGRLEDVRNAIVVGATTVAQSLDDLPSAEGWELGEVSAKFGVTLTAGTGVILTQASAGATFEVTVRFQRHR